MGTEELEVKHEKYDQMMLEWIPGQGSVGFDMTQEDETIEFIDEVAPLTPPFPEFHEEHSMSSQNKTLTTSFDDEETSVEEFLSLMNEKDEIEDLPGSDESLSFKIGLVTRSTMTRSTCARAQLNHYQTHHKDHDQC